MTFTETETTGLELIAQLEEQIRAAEAQRIQVREALILHLRSQGLSLRDIGAKIGTSHATVKMVLALHAARTGRAA